MVEDNNGFLWVATDAGIARFDGKYFQVFTIKDGLPDNEVLKVVKEKDGTIWVNCFKKVPAYFDAVKNRFVVPEISNTEFSKTAITNIMYLYALPDGGVMYVNNIGSFI